MAEELRIGTAGWSVPADIRDRFEPAPTALGRYASRFPAVEINSTFYRPHRPDTFRRWSETTPETFQFSLKAPRSITHEARLADAAGLLESFLEQTSILGEKRGPIVLQLPPKLAFDEGVAAAFFRMFRDLYEGLAALEPRHPSWFDAEPERLLEEHRIARIAADPPRAPSDGQPAGWRGFSYWRLHGAPRVYYSAYDDDYIAALRSELLAVEGAVWCIFDNTVSGAAARNALSLIDP